MRVVFITSNFPNPLEPTRGMFNFYTARALARTHDVVVIAQVSWRDVLRLRRGGRALPRVEMMDGIEVHHPRHWYPPHMLSHGPKQQRTGNVNRRSHRRGANPLGTFGSARHHPGQQRRKDEAEAGQSKAYRKTASQHF